MKPSRRTFASLVGVIYILSLCHRDTTFAADLAVTIYNQNFAVVRDKVTLTLNRGTNLVRFADATAFVEPSSVILRDPANTRQFQVLEQNYRGDPISQEMLLALNEGKTLDFEMVSTEGNQTRREIVSGRLVRSGNAQLQPIIEIKGKLQFGLPGKPLFPPLPDNTILKPTLQWLIRSEEPSSFDAEVSYVTGEMRWEADYNLVLPEHGNELDMVGWITMDNQSGKSFENARVKLMAGDVSKIQRATRPQSYYGGGGGGGGAAPAPPVTEKSFDEYHLYNLENRTTLLDREKKQVEFVRAQGVKSSVIYVYDGARIGSEQNWNPEVLHTEPEYGTPSNTKVWVMREFTNSAANQLGIPLPKGQLRVYRRDSGGQMEFTGENVIDHTPRDELVRLTTGNAFDLVGERKRTDFKSDLNNVLTIDPATGLPVPQRPTTLPHPPYIDESFEITLRNRKKEPVEIRVVEHLYRWVTWEISKKSQDFRKQDAQTIEFVLPLEPNEQKEISYTVHYSW